MKSTGVAFVCWFFGLHYFYFGKFGVGVVFLFTLGGFGLWWIVDLFRLKEMVLVANGLSIKPAPSAPSIATSNVPSDTPQMQSNDPAPTEADEAFDVAYEVARNFINKGGDGFFDARRIQFIESAPHMGESLYWESHIRIVNESKHIYSTTIRTETAIGRLRTALEHQLYLYILISVHRHMDVIDRARNEFIEMAAGIEDTLLMAASREIVHEEEKIESSKTTATRAKRITALKSKLAALSEECGVDLTRLTVAGE